MTNSGDAVHAVVAPAPAAPVEALRQQVRDLEAVARTRSLVDQALGVIMAQNRCDADAALRILLRASQHRNVRMTALAETIIGQVAGHVAEPRAVRPRAS